MAVAHCGSREPVTCHSTQDSLPESCSAAMACERHRCRAAPRLAWPRNLNWGFERCATTAEVAARLIATTDVAWRDDSVPIAPFAQLDGVTR